MKLKTCLMTAAALTLLSAATAFAIEPQPATEPPQGAPVAAKASTSTGAFTAPDLKTVSRTPFGPKAGTATDRKPVPAAVKDSGTFTLVFGGAAALALAVTAGAAFSLSRTTAANGSKSRVFTLGSKLAVGFGGVVTGILVLAMFSSRASTTITNAAADVSHINEQELLVLETDGDLASVRLHVKNFLISNSADSLVKYSDEAASLTLKLDLVKKTIVNPERVKMVDAYSDKVDEYFTKLNTVVALVDERNGIIESQMNVAAGRTTDLLAEIVTAARNDGDGDTALTAATAGTAFQLARVDFFKYLRTGDLAQAQAAVKKAEETNNKIRELQGSMQGKRGAAQLAEASGAIAFWLQRMERAEKLQNERNELVKNGLDKIGPQIAQTSSELIESLTKSREEVAEQAQAAVANARITTIGVAATIAALGAVLAMMITRSVQRPLAALNDRIKDIAQGEGDLTKRIEVKTRDEIGTAAEWLNLFIDTVERVVAEVKSGAAQIDAGGSQIASASQSMAQGASEQASSLQQISASLEQISGQTRQSAENARQASSLAEENKRSADRGQQEMSQMTGAVNEIKQSSAEISKIIKVIDEIAFQTNLLALNAAVEAARAGEAGKGFAVVAEEVRNLAQRSAEAAKNTSAMIEESVKRSENGVQIAARVGSALEEINASTNKVNTLLSEIANASGEQATGINQINQGVTQLDQVTQQNAGNSEELASSAEEMSSQVASLNELVGRFKVSMNAGTGTRPVPTKPAAKLGAPTQPVRGAGKTPAKAGEANRKKAGAHNDAEKMIPLESEEVLAAF